MTRVISTAAPKSPPGLNAARRVTRNAELVTLDARRMEAESLTVDMEYAVPDALTRGKQKVTVRFSGAGMRHLRRVYFFA
jgi:hypothetical protein